MSGSLVIVLIIVVWLFVLAPLLLRGQKPIRKAGEAFDETRVIHEGGSGVLRSRRRPRVTPADVRAPRDEDDENYELVDVDDVLIDDREEGQATGGIGNVFASASAKFRRRESKAEDLTEDRVVDGDLVHELESAPTESTPETTVTLAMPAVEAVPEPDEFSADDKYYEVSEAYTSPADLLDPRAAGDPAPAAPVTRQDAHDFLPAEADDVRGEGSSAADGDLTEEELEFAQRRRGRGGWDPEADEHQSLTRYQRRQRTLLGLGAGVAVSVILGFIFGGWIWTLPVLAVALSVFYLAALRGQVRQEQALRARRIRQLRRSRLGVRRSEEDERPLPRQLRRPGAVVLEIDDESPDFEHLEAMSPTAFDRAGTSQHATTYDLSERRRVS
ncbi:gephyrin-like molybdotransferase receptor GlpR [Corynebacterium halotolerans]|uniref:divisome protein SepX/GlpR n=1 Tax=Corynebacterium halotolerans TaxID=225326 RepID=UPI003CEC899D